MLCWQKRRRREEEKDLRRNEEYYDGEKNRLPFDGVGRVADDDDDAIGG